MAKRSRLDAGKFSNTRTTQAGLRMVDEKGFIEQDSPPSPRNAKPRTDKVNSLKNMRAPYEAGKAQILQEYQLEADSGHEVEPPARKRRKVRPPISQDEEQHFWAAQKRFSAAQHHFFADPARIDSLNAATAYDRSPSKNAEPFTTVQPTQVYIGQRSKNYRGWGMHTLEEYDATAYEPVPHSHPRSKRVDPHESGPAVQPNAPGMLSTLDQEGLSRAKKSEDNSRTIPRKRLDTSNEDAGAWRAGFGQDEPDLQDMSLFPGLEGEIL